MDTAEGSGIWTEGAGGPTVQIYVLCLKKLPVVCVYESHLGSIARFRPAWWWSLRAKQQLEMMHKAESSCKNVCKYINIHKQLQRRQDRYGFLLKKLFLSLVGATRRQAEQALSKGRACVCFCVQDPQLLTQRSQLRELHEALQYPT